MKYMGYWDRRFRAYLATGLGPECAYPWLARRTVELAIEEENK